MGLSARPNQFVELHLDGLGIAVLRVLDEEHHEERHNGRARINDQLPRVTVAEARARDRLAEDDGDRQRERGRPAGPTRGPLREAGKPGRRLYRSHIIPPRKG